MPDFVVIVSRQRWISHGYSCMGQFLDEANEKEDVLQTSAVLG